MHASAAGLFIAVRKNRNEYAQRAAKEMGKTW
jgi:hypothetical protein